MSLRARLVAAVCWMRYGYCGGQLAWHLLIFWGRRDSPDWALNDVLFKNPPSWGPWFRSTRSSVHLRCWGRTLSSFLSTWKLTDLWPLLRREQRHWRTKIAFHFSISSQEVALTKAYAHFTSSIMLGLCSYPDLAPMDPDCSRVQLFHAVFSSFG